MVWCLLLHRLVLLQLLLLRLIILPIATLIRLFWIVESLPLLGLLLFCRIPRIKLVLRWVLCLPIWRCCIHDLCASNSLNFQLLHGGRSCRHRVRYKWSRSIRPWHHLSRLLLMVCPVSFSLLRGSRGRLRLLELIVDRAWRYASLSSRFYSIFSGSAGVGAHHQLLLLLLSCLRLLLVKGLLLHWSLLLITIQLTWMLPEMRCALLTVFMMLLRWIIRRCSNAYTWWWSSYASDPLWWCLCRLMSLG